MTTIKLPLPPSTNPRPSPEAVWEAYCRTKSVHKAGPELGISHSVAHRILLKAGYKLLSSKWTDNELAALTAYYRDTPHESFSVEEIAGRLKRPYSGVAGKASSLGLSNISRPKSAAARANGKVAHQGKWTRNEHPRGATGMRHSAETLALVAAASRKNWATWKAFQIGPMSPELAALRSDRASKAIRTRMFGASSPYSRAAHGRREDLGGVFFRSAWEANYARYLNLLIAMGAIEKWEYEPHTFWFEEIRRGVRSYTPDFRVYENGELPYFVEVKGWMDAKSKTKIARLRKYYPDVVLRVVGQKQYSAIKQSCRGLIPCWE